MVLISLISYILLSFIQVCHPPQQLDCSYYSGDHKSDYYGDYYYDHVWAVDDNGCRTPSGGVGECINIDDCEPIRKMVKGRSLTKEESQQLQNYHCSYSRSTIKVCCPSDPNPIEWADNTRCTTPTGESGSCKSIYSCQPMLNFIQKAGSNIDQDTKAVLQQYSCGFESNGAVKVCCPSTEISVGTKDHPNLKLIPVECGISNPLDRITNGQKTDLFEFPWQAALRYTSKKAVPFHCGGALINNRYILTAAHCIKSSLTLTGVRLGEYDFATEPDCIKGKKSSTCAPAPVEFDVSESDAIVHPGYNRETVQNDIALIRLPADVVYSDAIGPVCLPYKNEFVKKEFRNLTVIGWGSTENGFASTILLKVTVPHVTNPDCLSVFRNKIQLSEKQFCAGGKDGKDSCAGDSGSPIMFSLADGPEIRWVQAGLVSYGTKACGSEKIPAVYTKIDQYMKWILDNIKP